MKIAIVATGGVGGYFGARLAAAGEEVHFIARGAHLAALRADGLKLKSANGDLHLQEISATDDPAHIGAVETVIFAVKQYDTGSAANLIKPLIGANTAVISLQNGMVAFNTSEGWSRDVSKDVAREVAKRHAERGMRLDRRLRRFVTRYVDERTLAPADE